MRLLLQEVFLILAVIGIVRCGVLETDTYQYEDYNDDNFENKGDDKPCPRDCICISSTSSTVAKCNRLEVGTQKFGEDITDLIVENVNKKHPIVLSDRIFNKLGLDQVINIKIVNSIVTEISSTAFDGLNDLYSVNLTGNRIQKLHENTFASNKDMYLLSLSNNPLELSQMKDSQAFLNSSSIQELDVSHCNLTSVPSKAFLKLKNLMYINLSGNKLKNIDSKLFSYLKDLEEVDLSDNFLKGVPFDLFANNSEMTSLNIGRNPINTIRGMTFSELLTLNLNQASIKTIGPEMFLGMNFISNLNLSGNGIEKIYNLAFSSLKEMNFLDLSNNNLYSVSEEMIRNNVQLDVLKISNNILLKNLPSNGFLSEGDQYFNIYLFDASGCSLESIPDNTFKSMPALTQLNLARNKIYSLGSSLNKAMRLIELDLSYNNIENLDKTTFAQNKDLTKLNLAGNPIVTLSTEVFINNQVLTWLDLSACQLFQLWENGDNHPEHVLHKLHHLNISGNQLQVVYPKDLQMINKLHTLDITQNLLQCTPDFEKLVIWLGEKNISPAAKDVKISNMKIEGSQPDARYQWEFLAKQVCGFMPSTSTALPEKEVTIDPKEENILKKIDETTHKDENGDYIIDEDKEDYYYDESNEVFKHNETYANLGHSSDANVKNKINQNSLLNDLNVNKLDDLDDLQKDDIFGDVDVTKLIHDVHTFDKDLEDDLDGKIYEVKIDEYTREDLYSRNLSSDTFFARQTLFIVYIILLFVLLLAFLLIIRVVRRRYSNNLSSIVTVSGSSQGRFKKDCGLVYQPLSEDLTGPRTPIIKKHMIIDNFTSASLETNPFYQKVNPEVV
ncbi:leucine-rich repeat domain-containing glycoprotein 150 [Arctopsyche grandis]|uniref:leucine-rich repeat domain-containing glycoprotein 150 n=1 Tax=Arctopsyche grandis TaxID=121162 RepID=UPI00406D86EE